MQYEIIVSGVVCIVYLLFQKIVQDLDILEKSGCVWSQTKAVFSLMIQQHCCSHASMIQSVQTSSLLLFLWL